MNAATALSHEPSRGATPSGEQSPKGSIQRSDPRFEELYRENVRWISNYVFRRTGDLHATEDVVSDIFLAALRTMRRFEDRGIPLRFWLLRIATNAISQWARKGRRPLKSVPDVEACAPTDTTSEAHDSDGMDIERARRAMHGLPRRQQDVLALHYLEGLSTKEVALVLDCRVGTVKSALARGREALRQRLEDPRRKR